MINLNKVSDEIIDLLVKAYNLSMGTSINREEFFQKVRDAHENAKNTCQCCFESFTDEEAASFVTLENGSRMCPSCFAEHGFTCECGKRLLKEEMVHVFDENDVEVKQVCKQCSEDTSKYFIDEYSGKTFVIEALCQEIFDDSNKRVAKCYSRYYRRCEDCGTWFCHNGRDVRYCESCAENHPSYARYHVYGYSVKPNPKFKKMDEEATPRYMGVELETEPNEDSCNTDYDAKNYSKNLHDISDDENLFYQKCDGSLADNGVEIVTHPCSLDFMMKEFPWNKIVATARKYRYVSHKGGNCGLHVHVDRKSLGNTPGDQDATIAKIILLTDRFWNKIVKFTRRTEDRINEWACKPNAEINSSDTIESAVRKSKDVSSYSRYRAVNLRNRNTIEFRIFRGTLAVNTIKATLQFVDRICEYAKNNQIDKCLTCSWTELMVNDAPDELKTYLEQRGLM